MIKLNTPSSSVQYGHTLRCKKAIGTFKPSTQNYSATMMKCHGRLYKPDKGPDGKYIDTVGVPDERIMVMTWENYCIATRAQLDDAFDEV